MRRGFMPLAIAGALTALAVIGGLTGCSSGSSTGAAITSEANLSGSPVSAKDDMTGLCDQIVTQALPLEAAVALAEASGYPTRVGTLDGKDQAVTADLRDDRFTFGVEAGVVVKCTIG